MRQRRPESSCALDDSAARVQVVEGIHQAGDGLDQCKGSAIERYVRILEPRPGDFLIAPDNGVE